MKRDQTPRSAGLLRICRAAAWAGPLLFAPLAASAEGHTLVLLPELPPFMSGVAKSIGAPVGWNLVILLLLFPALLPFVNAFVLKPLLRVLDEREARTAGTRAKAEKLEQDAAAILLRYEAAVRATREESERGRRTLLTEVRSETQREISAARGDAESRLESARGEITSALASARAGLRAEAQELARQAASQVLGRAL
jgi:F-type H+-transporting ATPase subunit b